MIQQTVLSGICIFSLFMVGVPACSAVGNSLLSGRETTQEVLKEDNDSPGCPIPRYKYLQKQVTSVSVMSENNHRHYARNSYERYAFFNSGENKKKTLNLRALHKYSGYATLGAAFITGVSKSSRSLHCNSAKGTAALAAATVLSGLVNYGFPALERSNILSHRMLHRLMGTAGMVGCVTAVYLAESNGFSSHPGLGVAGAGLMAASVVLVKW